MAVRYVIGWVACIECNDGGRFLNGRRYLYGGPFPKEYLARDWAAAFDNATLVRVERNEVPHDRIVGLDRELMEDA